MILSFSISRIEAEPAGSITLDLVHVDGSDRTNISGASVSIYQVWSYENNKIVMTSPFTYSGNTDGIGEMSSKQIQDLKKDFLPKIKSAKAVATKTSDSNGHIEFNDLSTGAYLIVQNEPAVIDNVSYMMDSFLITIPYRIDDNSELIFNPNAVNIDDNVLMAEYEYSAAPKFTVTRGFTIRKLDEETGKPLPGATLVITDSKGNVVYDKNGNRCEWVTGKDKVTIYLDVLEDENDYYILKETKVPAGYLKARDIKFKVAIIDDEYTILIMNDDGEFVPVEDFNIDVNDPVKPPYTIPKTGIY